MAALIRARMPDAASLLDVGCGTGKHLEHLRGTFPDVVGVEPAPAMRARAAARLPGVPLIDADMWNFDVERQFDAVICLFSVIGYAGGPDGSLAGLREAIDTMVAHLVAGGVLVIEPWIYPRQFEPGHIANDYCHAGDRYIYRMGHSRIAPDRPRVSELTLHYLVGQASGIEHFTDVHRLSMFTRRDLTTAIKRAGCTAEILEPGFGRSLIVGVRT